MTCDGQPKNKEGYSRRDFLRKGAAAGLGISVAGAALTGCHPPQAGPPESVRHAPLDRVRIGFVGVGLQGSSHVRNFLRLDRVEIKAVCDIVEWKVRRIQNWVKEAGQPEPEGYFRSETDFMRLCDREDLDLVFTATPWRWHEPICVDAMKKGKHAATEVPAAVTLDECWRLVETSEKTERHCVMMENCCYSDRALLTLNLVRKGLLGEILNGECGYLHDLRGVKFSGRDESLWRTAHSIARNGNLYPTHGLGPVAEAMDINRGDRFDFLVSLSCGSRGLNLYASEKFGPTSQQALQKYALGDVNTSIIQTKKGRTITVIHDTNLPRPYSRVDRVQGSKGLIEGYPDRVYIEGKSEPHQWDSFEPYMEQYQHPLWKEMAELAKGAGHGGMDFLEDYRLVDALLKGRHPDMDVYDAAAWSAVSELSEISVVRRGQPMAFPDFTRGAWKNNSRIFIADM